MSSSFSGGNAPIGVSDPLGACGIGGKVEKSGNGGIEGNVGIAAGAGAWFCGGIASIIAAGGGVGVNGTAPNAALTASRASS